MATYLVDRGKSIGRRPRGTPILNRESAQAIGLGLWYPCVDGPTAGFDYSGRGVHLALRTSVPRTGVGGPAAQGLTGGDATIGIPTGFDSCFECTATTEFFRNGLSGLGSTANPFSLCGWMYMDASTSNGAGAMFMVGYGTGGPRWGFDGSFLPGVTNGSNGGLVISSSVGFANSKWRAVVYTWDGTNSRIYVNGLQANSNTTAPDAGMVSNAGIWSNTHETFLGHIGGGDGWRLADLRYYMRALSATEVWALYDPSTRWDLYWTPGRRVFFDIAAGGGTGTGGLVTGKLVNRGLLQGRLVA